MFVIPPALIYFGDENYFMRPAQLFTSLLSLVTFIATVYTHQESSARERLITYHKKINDTCWQSSLYPRTGPLLRMETYKDKKRTLAHGRFAYYDIDGLVDSTGYYVNGQREGRWYYYSNSKVSLHKEYRSGVVTAEKEYPEKPDNKEIKDPKEEDVKSEFAGGIRGWQRYLVQNLRYPTDAFRSRIQGAVQIAFVVDETGSVGEPWVFKSVDYLLDEEALRLIVKSPQWTPATKDSKPVKSYKRQPIVFRLSY
jgi:protein TonB